MLTIAIVNEKGGSGKTTTSVNLAAALGAVNQRVLLVDLDGQAAATRWLGVEGDTRFADALWRGEGLEPLSEITPNVDLAPGHAKLDSVAHDLRPTQGGQLRKLLREVEDEYDIAMIDCPPSLGNRVIGNALVAATHAIVPVETSILAMDCMQSLLETIQDVRDGLGHDIELMGILACRFDGRTNLSRSVLSELHRALPGKVLNSIIRENVRLRECPAAGESILTYAPRSSGAKDYIYLADEIVSIIEGSWEPIERGEDTKPRKKKKSRSKSKSKTNTKAGKSDEKFANAEQAETPSEEKTDQPAQPQIEETSEPKQDQAPQPAADEPKPVATIEVPEVSEEIDWSTVNFDESSESVSDEQDDDSQETQTPDIHPAEADWNLDEQTAQTTEVAAEDKPSDEPLEQAPAEACEAKDDQPETPAVEELSWNLDGENPSVVDGQADQGDAPAEPETQEPPADLAWDFNAETAEKPNVEQPAADQTQAEQSDDDADADEPEWQLDSAASAGPQAQTVDAISEAATSAQTSHAFDPSVEDSEADEEDEEDSLDDWSDQSETMARTMTETVDALAESAPAAAPQPAAPPSEVPTPAWPTAESEFYRPVLEAIVSLGGSAKEEHVMERIREIMDGKLNEVDLAPPADGRSKEPVWQQTVNKAKRLLTIDGLMKEQRIRRTWKITARGKEAVANHDQQRIYD
jgi:chromosome partitioning protein